MGDRTRDTSRLEGMLEDASIKLSSVASSLTTVSARTMLDALIAGERDPHSQFIRLNDCHLAADGSCASGVVGDATEAVAPRGPPPMPRRSSKLDGHPLVTVPGSLRAILDAAPICLLVTDEHGEIVHRNPASEQTLTDAVAAHGREAVGQLRDGMAEFIRELRSFPAHELLVVGTMTAQMHFGKVPGGVVVSWRDITAQQQLMNAATSLADALSADGSGLAELGDTMAGAVGDSAGQAEALSIGARELTESIQEISASTSAAVTTTQDAVRAADAAAASVARLTEYSSAIGNVSRLITGIAEQTKLLALNATIESARAGEAGKGFAVVASEVKELAERTERATSEISSTIEHIQAGSAQAATAIGDIVARIGEMEQQQTTIAGAVEEQSATAKSMAQATGVLAGSAQASGEAVDGVREAATSLAARAAELRRVLADQQR